MTSQPFRLPQGGLVDRSRLVTFRFDGREYTGHPGDTLASALIAGGTHMVARSFKYHRPRGILGAGVEDPAALVEIGSGIHRDPNVRVTEAEIHDGLEAHAQNVWPSLTFDVGEANDLLWRFFPAGFYYKTFMGGPRGWMTWEPFIRRAAGMGRAPDGPDPDPYEQTNRHCDVLVVGAGPAGLMAALSAARSGARVILAEETAALGGRLLSRDPAATHLDDRAAPEWIGAVAAELRSREDVTVLTRTSAFGYYGENFLGLWERVGDHLPRHERSPNLPRQRLWRVRAKQVVLATGAIERPLVFHENDRPGIMLASAAVTYVHRYGVLPGRNVLVFANNDSGWGAAFDLAESGASIAAIVDVRREIDGALLSRAAALGIAIHAGCGVVGTSGRFRVTGAKVQPVEGAGGVSDIACDLVAVAGGWTPNTALFAQSRGKLRWDDDLAAYRPGLSWQKEASAGASNGVFDLSGCLAAGAEAGARAADAAGFSAVPAPVPALRAEETLQRSIHFVAEVPSHRKPEDTRAWVDLQDDVTTKDLKLALQEGMQSIEHAKRYTTTGMGTDQGKVANLNAFRLVSDKLGRPMHEIGTTTSRQPWKPVTFGALAGQHVGHHFHPRRGTPMHDWHRRHSAVFEPVGDWLRPRAFLKAGESFEQAVQREARAAREGVAVLDATTLGKIDIQGKGAREFLNRVYTSAWTKLAPGRCRYGFMLGEDGMVLDDGVTSCIADDHFHMTTTTGGAARIYQWLEDYAQTEWPDLELYLTSVTEQWAVASLSGRDSRAVVEEICDDFDADPATFPFMSFRDTTIEGVPARIFRISFTGALSYEINVPASYGLWLWEKIFEAGARFGITPYGTETMHLLRAEKGFVIVGQDTDGTVTPHDLRMDWIVSDTKGDFIGKRSLSRSDTARADRKQLVGLLTEDPGLMLEEGAHVIATENEPAPPVPMLGHVTSSYLSPNIGRSIALALVAGGGDRMGDRLWVTRPGGAPIPVRVTETDFLKLKEEGHV
ncbi:sarcosine oxidase subunit alpha family protein [Lutibaculum baratangense]|uniref:Sarcosine oxidase alpha subunit n=1 Tax=Lutibaculum baratangense AMV1 TaxID=631454 RepID=V4RHT5_9HYPH|nr:sarcosine oxidase subunit alpha family protein [Lutibaculum baratangense]ESR22830.1 Sarcosine oxidase alpha subunit [Lutibaculum baratangense AMV1]